MNKSSLLILAALASLLAVPGERLAAQTVAPFYAGAYAIRDVGAAPDVPGRYGGLAFKAGTTNTLLIGGDGNTHDAKIYQVTVVRGTGGHITGFSGSATVVADAYGPDTGGIDGGLAVGPGNVLFYTTYDDNSVGQVKPGSTNVSKLIRLNPDNLSGLPGGVGSLVFVPAGMPGAGRLKILDYWGGNWWDTTTIPDGAGTYNLGAFSAPILLNIGCEGAFYVPAGNPRFANHSVLICDYGSSAVVSYQVNNNGDPIPATKQVFISDLFAPEGGAADPVTGDFVFSSFDGVHLYVVSGFTGGLNPPVVTITAPEQNARFAAPASFDVVASAIQTNGSINQVQFFTNGVSAGIAAVSPYVVSLDSLPAGAYVLTAVATGNGLSSTSAPVVVVVTNPAVGVLSVALTAPADNTTVFDCCGTVIAAIAANSGGTVSAVEFFNHGTNLLATFSAPPYRLTLATFGLATNKLTAVASDGLGHSVTSAVVTVRVVGLVATNRLAIVSTSTNTVGLCFRGLVGSNYVFEVATNLLATNMLWAPFRTNVAPANTFGELSIPDTNVLAAPRRFYRAKRQ
ncbi:MAG: Ig-like domain-containing protein [Verrucomicrobia bacterium]|nr:Ig-like domain-containing protein [Verrucomicrobiota bacterium]